MTAIATPAISNVEIPNASMKVGSVVTVKITVANDGGEVFSLYNGTVAGYALSNLTRVNATTYNAYFTVPAGGTDSSGPDDDIEVYLILSNSLNNRNTAYTESIVQFGDSINANAPTQPTLSNSSLLVTSGANATVGTVSSTDASPNETLTYSFTSGAGDTNNTAFSLSGDVLHVNNPGTLGAGVYSVRIQVVDAGGNSAVQQFSITLTSAGPSVSSIVRAASAPATVPAVATSVAYTVTFSEAVSGVDATDFVLTGAGSGTVASAVDSGDGIHYTVTVNNVSGNGTLRLDLKASGTGIQNTGLNAITGGYTGGESYTVDHIVPVTPAAPAMAAGSDTGASSSDGITSNTAPLFSGTAEADGTITLYDSDGTTVLGSTTSGGGGSWSITPTAAMTEGAHSVTVKQTDSAGNVSLASPAKNIVIDTTAPTTLALSAVRSSVTNASAGTALATLSASDSNAITYSLVAGSAGNDASNSLFTITGTTLKPINNLAANAYSLYVRATDAAGNHSEQAFTFTVVSGPSVASIVRADSVATVAAASATSLTYTVTFSEEVIGVSYNDFTLVRTGTATGTIGQIEHHNGVYYTVTIDGLGGDGTIGLNVNASGTDIKNQATQDLVAGFTGQVLTLDHTPDAAPAAPILATASDSGSSSSDSLTNNTTPVFNGTAEAGRTVTLYDSNGTTVLGSTTAGGGGDWSITPTVALTEGSHSVTVKQTDLAGNVSPASAPTSVVIDTTAPTTLALSATTAVDANATAGAALATLSASDSHAITYSLVAGSAGNDASNSLLTIDGTTLKPVGALAANTYQLYARATDAAGNHSEQAFTFTVVSGPSVASIVRADSVASVVAASATSLTYTVTFSEEVIGVSSNDFTVVRTGTATGTIGQIEHHNGVYYTVTIDGLGGDGTIGLNVNASGTGIKNQATQDLVAGFTGNVLTLDHTPDAAPTSLVMETASDTGSSNSDGITSNVTPVFTGSAAADSTVTLYDTDGTTVLGSTTAGGGGSWSITPTAALAEGAHSVTVKQSDAAGNVSPASLPKAIVIDSTAPTAIALSVTSVVDFNATAGAPVATLSATDVQAVAYSLVSGSGGNDAANVLFIISGTTLKPLSNLAAGTYRLYVSATDAAGNQAQQALTLTIFTVVIEPAVTSIVRADSPSPVVAASASSLTYTVTFSEAVTGVDSGDFTLATTGNAHGTITSVSGNGNTYTVTVNALAGDGTLHLDLNGSGTGIQNGSGTAIGGGYTVGQVLTLDHTVPAMPGAPLLTGASDTGISNADGITSNSTPTFTGSAEANSTVTLYDTNGTAVLGSTTADSSGNWRITSSRLGEGAHGVTVRQIDAAGNVSPASAPAAVVIDSTAPVALVLSSTTATVSSATAGASIATLSATDAHALAYSLVPGSGGNDASNALFTIIGNTLTPVSNLAAGTYHLYTGATDAAGNHVEQAFTFTVINPPGVTSIARADAASATVGASVNTVSYTVTFNQAVTGVDASDFTVTGSGSASGSVSAVTGSGASYTVTVNSIAGDGTLRLDLNGSGTGIVNGDGGAVPVGYTGGETYLLDHTPPDTPAGLHITATSDSGSSSSDGITAIARPTFEGSGTSGSMVTLRDTDGLVLGTGVVDNAGHWSIVAGAALSEGPHRITASAFDAAGNVSAASAALALIIDRSAATALTLSNSAVRNNAAANTVVGTLSNNDSNNGQFSYALVAGAGADANAAFSIDNGSLRLLDPAHTPAGVYSVRVQVSDSAGNSYQQALAITVSNAPTVPVTPPVEIVDGVPVQTAPVPLPGGGSGTAVVIPVIEPGRTDSNGATPAADIPLVSAGGESVLVAHLPAGLGLSATGGTSAPAGSSLVQLSAAIAARTAGDTSGDQGHLTDNGLHFLSLLPSTLPLLVNTIVLEGNAGSQSLILTGTASDTLQTALVLDTRALTGSPDITLEHVAFAAVIGRGTVRGDTGGQILSGDGAAQHFIISGNASTLVESGGGNDMLELVSAVPLAASAVQAVSESVPGNVVVSAAMLLNGGSGADTVILGGNQVDYTVQRSDGHVVVTDKISGVSATLGNVESIRFADGVVQLDSRAELGKIAALYQNALGRQADIPGFELWGGLQSGHGVSLGQIALDIIGSAESAARGNVLQGNAAHDVALLYQALFGRAADAEGAAFWVNAMAQGVTLAQVADGMLASTEMNTHALAATAWDFHF